MRKKTLCVAQWLAIVAFVIGAAAVLWIGLADARDLQSADQLPKVPECNCVVPGSEGDGAVLRGRVDEGGVCQPVLCRECGSNSAVVDSENSRSAQKDSGP